MREVLRLKSPRVQAIPAVEVSENQEIEGSDDRRGHSGYVALTVAGSEVFLTPRERSQKARRRTSRSGGRRISDMDTFGNRADKPMRGQRVEINGNRIR